MPTLTVKRRPVLAIDPGAAGGLCLMAWKGNARRVMLHRMPRTLPQLHALLSQLILVEGRHNDTSLPPLRVVLERVQGFIGRAHPGSAMFTFGQGFGRLEALVLSLTGELPEYVRPEA